MNKGSLRLRANTKEPFEYKQVIVIRTDLGMSKGKIAVQVAHAAVSAVEQARRHQLTWLRAWLREGQKKVVVKVPGSEELLALFDREPHLGYEVMNSLLRVIATSFRNIEQLLVTGKGSPFFERQKTETTPTG